MPRALAHSPQERTFVDFEFLRYFGCQARYGTFAPTGRPTGADTYFHFGPDLVCYGQHAAGQPAAGGTHRLDDALRDVGLQGSTLQLPFNPSDIVDNLRYERYVPADPRNERRLWASSLLQSAYYLARPLLALSVRKHLQRARLRDWKDIRFPQWPVDPTVEGIFEELMALTLRSHSVDRIPFIWFWPGGAQSCVIMTHDVETAAGRDFCGDLMDLDDEYGIKASFQVVPEGRYEVSEGFLDSIRERGFEINVHDLNHDGKLFTNKKRFQRRAKRINHYGRKFRAEGFRSAVLYRNLEWLRTLDFAYDMSVPSVGHLEAQRGGCCSVMPFFIGEMTELPVTTTQDYALFHILNQYSIDLWKRQIAGITERHGLMSFIVHPDYIRPRRACDTYRKLLAYLADLRSEARPWFALPGAVSRWWRDRSRMKLVQRGKAWEIEGPNKEQARVAYASLVGNKVAYRLDMFAMIALRDWISEASLIGETACSLTALLLRA
jgi:hypothetical protein